jgi:GNAT superfamily N-acetyltransferase
MGSERAAATTPIRITHADVAWHEAFLRYVGRIFPSADFRTWYARGGWTPAYEVHAVAQGGELVASASVMCTPAIASGRQVRGAQVGAVGSVPEARGQGLMRPLLEGVLAWVEPEAELIWLYANEAVLDFYPRFGFRRVQEAEFELELALAPTGEPAPRLDLEDAVQRAAWVEAIQGSVPLTERLGAWGYSAAALWHAVNFHREDVRVLGDREAYAVAVQRGDTLHLLDVAAPRRFDLTSIIPRLIQEPITRVRFGFCPERWCPAARVVGSSDEALFVRGTAAIPGEPFKLPALSQT